MPGRMYGSTAVVLRNSVVRAGTFTAPMDSGAWIQMCNATRQMSSYPCDSRGWGPGGRELLQNASACLCDSNTGHDLARCEAAQREHNPQGLTSRNPLCVWSNGSTETRWQCPGGLQSNGCTNGSVVSRPAPAGSPKTNGSCSLLPGLTVNSTDAAGRNLWFTCRWSGPGDQCGVCAAIPTATHKAQGTLAGCGRTNALSSCCASTAFPSKTVPFRAVCPEQVAPHPGHECRLLAGHHPADPAERWPKRRRRAPLALRPGRLPEPAQSAGHHPRPVQPCHPEPEPVRSLEPQDPSGAPAATVLSSS